MKARDKARFEIQANFCKAMAHPVRLEIIHVLKGGGRSVHEIADEVGVGQANLSQHLAILRARGVVRAERRGNGVEYSLANRKIVEACELIRSILQEQADRAQAAIVG